MSENSYVRSRKTAEFPVCSANFFSAAYDAARTDSLRCCSFNTSHSPQNYGVGYDRFYSQSGVRALTPR